MPGDESYDSIRLRRIGAEFEQWPKLSCTEIGELTIAADDPAVPVNLQTTGALKATSFQGDGSTLDGVVKKAGDTMTGSLTIQNNLIVNGSIGIGAAAPATKLEVNGTVKATSFQGDGSTLDGVVKKAGDIITGPLKLQNSLIVDGNVGIGATIPSTKLEVNGTIKATSFQGDGSGLTGIATLNSGQVAIAQLKTTLVADGSIAVSETARVEIQRTQPNEHPFYLASVSCVSSNSPERLPFSFDFQWRLQVQPITRRAGSPIPPFWVAGNIHTLVIEIPEEVREALKSLGISFTVAYKVYRLSET